jgi:hypothetical protein
MQHKKNHSHSTIFIINLTKSHSAKIQAYRQEPLQQNKTEHAHPKRPGLCLYQIYESLP